MTALYRPVLIESAEQAEALPIGTITLDLLPGRGIPEACTKDEDGRWRGALDHGRPYTFRATVGDYALVPIKAEEEQTRMVVMRGEWVSFLSPSKRAFPEPWSRLVTPWEERQVTEVIPQGPEQ